MAALAFNYKLSLKILGNLLLAESFFLLTALGIEIIYKEGAAFGFITAICVSTLLGTVFIFAGKNAPPDIGKREGSVIVTGIWILFTLIGLLPFWISGSIPDFTNAFFETMSGFTTTGASILSDIEQQPHSILFWRSLTQWIGGLGIIVITLAILPLLGFTSVQLFAAEADGPAKDKIHPKTSETAKRLLSIYVVLTIIETLLLKAAGMNWFDAVCHSFATIATGGFSTKQTSIAHWNSPMIEYITIFFMIFSGVNFSLYYFLVKLKGKKIFKNEELKYYFLILLVFTALITISNFGFSKNHTWESFEKAGRESLFMVSSIMTTTGYTAYDYMRWLPFTWIMLLILMISGASSGSTSGGIKVVRVVFVIKFCYYEFKRMIHPNAVLPIRYNGHVVRNEVITRVVAFALLYCILIMLGILVLSFNGLGFMESVSGMITCLSDVGPGLGEFAHDGSFVGIPVFTKWFLSFVMLIGRLELFTVLLILTPAFWKR
jgi:trk system potassium uptake protein TrkH